jgi:hypothetical protein
MWLVFKFLSHHIFLLKLHRFLCYLLVSRCNRFPQTGYWVAAPMVLGTGHPKSRHSKVMLPVKAPGKNPSLPPPALRSPAVPGTLWPVVSACIIIRASSESLRLFIQIYINETVLKRGRTRSDLILWISFWLQRGKHIRNRKKQTCCFVIKTIYITCSSR